MKVFENRASAVLYRFLKSNPVKGPFLLPANVCPIVPLTFLKAGVAFEFVDIVATHSMDRKMCLNKLKTDTYGGILFVHAYGKEFDNTEFYSLIKNIDSSICIIDDRCLCVPRLTEDVRQNVDLELYSTGYAKYIELSYGGWGIINRCLNYTREPLPFREEEFLEQMNDLRYCLNENQRYISSEKDWLDGSGIDAPEVYLDEIESRFAVVNSHKKRINAIYEQNLPLEIQWGNEYNHWRFMVGVNNREEILKALFSAGLFAGTNFPSVAYLFGGVHLPVAEQEQKQVLNLFNDFRVDEEFAYQVCKIMHTYMH